MVTFYYIILYHIVTFYNIILINKCYHGLWTFRSQDVSFPVRSGRFVRSTLRSLDDSFPGRFVLWTFRSLLLEPFIKCHCHFTLFLMRSSSLKNAPQ